MNSHWASVRSVLYGFRMGVHHRGDRSVATASREETSGSRPLRIASQTSRLAQNLNAEQVKVLSGVMASNPVKRECRLTSLHLSFGSSRSVRYCDVTTWPRTRIPRNAGYATCLPSADTPALTPINNVRMKAGGILTADPLLRSIRNGFESIDDSRNPSAATWVPTTANASLPLNARVSIEFPTCKLNNC